MLSKLFAIAIKCFENCLILYFPPYIDKKDETNTFVSKFRLLG